MPYGYGSPGTPAVYGGGLTKLPPFGALLQMDLKAAFYDLNNDDKYENWVFDSDFPTQ